MVRSEEASDLEKEGARRRCILKRTQISAEDGDEEASRAQCMRAMFPNWVCYPMTPQRRAITTIMRDRRTCGEEFVFYADRAIRLLIEDALNEMPLREESVQTPVDEAVYNGATFVAKICGVSIVRAGEAMEVALRNVCRGIAIGKLLIQRDERTLEPHLIYHKVPKDICKRHVLLMDPMLGTGGSAALALRVLTETYKVPQHRIVFCNLVCCPEGLKRLFKDFPHVKVVSLVCDRYLSDSGYIVPGFGDFGDRYFGTFKR